MKYFSLSIVLLLAGCAGSSTQAPPGEAAPLQAGWNRIEPGGETTCSDGSPYAFYVRPGDAAKLMVYFEGGGGCWFRRNCDPTLEPTYKINLAGQNLDRASGIFDFARTDNPFRDYTIVYAPYCTGDVHLGRVDQNYPPEAGQTGNLTIHHRGMTNAESAIDWARRSVTRPQTVFVAGSSAGSIPSPYYAWQLGEHYKDARIVQLGDGSGGYRRREGGNLPHTQWNTIRELEKHPAFAGFSDSTFSYDALYSRAAKARPDIQYAAYDAAEDAVQKRFLALSGIRDVSLFEMITANQNDIRSVDPDFRAFIAGGDSHTILMRPEFYSYRVGNVSIRDWVADLAEGNPVADAVCSECAFPELAGTPMPAAMVPLWKTWESPAQVVNPFWIFDNVAYVGIDWVAAYVIRTSEGLVLIDSLYGKWVPRLEQNLVALGLDPKDVKYVLSTHGHFDHAGGAACFQKRYGAKAVMSELDWALAGEKADLPYFGFPLPNRDIVAKDGDRITLGDTTIDVIATPGHTPGAISFVYDVRDGGVVHRAITLGGVGLNFSGVDRTAMYIASYERLLREAGNIAVSLPNHAAMGKVLERRDQLASRAAGAAHPFVDAAGYRASLTAFIAAAKDKLEKEKAGTAEDALTVLSRTLRDTEQPSPAGTPQPGSLNGP